MKKRALHKKNRKQSKQDKLSALHRTLIYCQESDRKYLRARYKNSSAVLERLSELFPTIATYELLGELFFEFMLHETEYGLPDEDRLKLLKNTRYEIVELYALTRAAKMLRNK